MTFKFDLEQLVIANPDRIRMAPFLGIVAERFINYRNERCYNIDVDGASTFRFEDELEAIQYG